MSTSDERGAGLPARGEMIWAMAFSGRAALAIAPDQRVGGAVVCQFGLGRALQLGDDSRSKLLAKLDTPLVERVDVPDRALREHAVFVQRDQLAQRLRRQG